MRSIREKSVRIGTAWLCMLAVALLYAPLAVAALLANGVGCCASGYCPIREHHHQKKSPAQEQAPMDCGHDMGGMTACSMSCCPDASRPAVTPVAFVLPEAAFVASPTETVCPVHMLSVLEISQFSTPLSPPPRYA